jgi:hypothetical protein
MPTAPTELDLVIGGETRGLKGLGVVVRGVVRDAWRGAVRVGRVGWVGVRVDWLGEVGVMLERVGVREGRVVF